MAKLILVRHGQSIWNLQNRFTGWINVGLTRQGRGEADKAGDLLQDYNFKAVFTSTLLRAHQTLFAILGKNKHVEDYILNLPDEDHRWYHHFTPRDTDQKTLMIQAAWQLNERAYGDLQGLNKAETAEKFGEEKVHLWRRSFEVPPPGGESLKMTLERALPYYESEIVPHLQKGEDVLIVAHGNSLRSIVYHLEKMTPEEVIAFELHTGVPRVYELNEKLEIVDVKMLQ